MALRVKSRQGSEPFAAGAAELNSAPSAVLRRAIWYVRCIVGFSLLFSGLWGLYRTFGVWWLPLSLASFMAGAMIVPGVAERFPRRW
jgi:hypothetical protein